MNVTSVSPELREPLFTQVARIVNSDVLRGSESLCHLLDFLANHAISDPGHPAKEYLIATEVFGRSEKFDARLDSTVRVQTSRLRAKLAEYYSGPGAEDAVIIEIPRGAYSLTVHSRPVVEDTAPAATPNPAKQVEGTGLIRYQLTTLILSLVCFLQLVTLIYALTRPAKPAGEPSPRVPPSLEILWRPFMHSPERTWVVFSNAEFVGRPETGMRYLDPARDKGADILDHYTGVGEVMAIHSLDQLFEQFRHGVLAKRGRLLAIDDVMNNDVIFVGSPSENLMLRDLPAAHDFLFGRDASNATEGPLRIVNLHPAPGEQPLYFASPGLPIKQDYAVIALLPGPAKQRWVMSLAGISTIGTQAAVEYVCSETSVAQLLKRAGFARGEVRPFEALIRVSISRGVPVSSELVSVRARNE